jgi:hypothetical protein
VPDEVLESRGLLRYHGRVFDIAKITPAQHAIILQEKGITVSSEKTEEEKLEQKVAEAHKIMQTDLQGAATEYIPTKMKQALLERAGHTIRECTYFHAADEVELDLMPHIRFLKAANEYVSEHPEGVNTRILTYAWNVLSRQIPGREPITLKMLEETIECCPYKKAGRKTRN